MNEAVKLVNQALEILELCAVRAVALHQDLGRLSTTLKALKQALKAERGRLPLQFVFREPRSPHPTLIRAGDTVQIHDRFYLVLEGVERVFTDREAVTRFPAVEITDPATLKKLKAREMACLVLNPNLVSEAYR